MRSTRLLLVAQSWRCLPDVSLNSSSSLRTVSMRRLMAFFLSSMGSLTRSTRVAV